MEKLRKKILDAVKEYYNLDKDSKQPAKKIYYSKSVHDEKEIQNLVKASLKFWLTGGELTDKFEEKFAKQVDMRYCSAVNSGSSANFLAFMALTSPLLGNRRIERDDEVITVGMCFPTTVSPIITFGAVPVFIDVDLETMNIDVSQIEDAITYKTRAIMIAHTLGNPFDIKRIKDLCDKHELWLIMDCCDALGSKYGGKIVDTYADLSTHSFFPAHTITSGEGGMVCTNDPKLYKIVNSFRDWGRDVKCDKCNRACRKRFEDDNDQLEDYDCKYTYSHFGFNMKITELQASIGLTQLDKLGAFIKKRKKNYDRYYKNLKKYQDYLILPKRTENSDPCWFAFWITLRENAPFKRIDLIKYLEANRVDTRMIFAGNIIKQKCFHELKEGKDYRIVGKLPNTDYIARNSFFVGVYPGIGKDQIDYICDKIGEFIKENT